MGISAQINKPYPARKTRSENLSFRIDQILTTMILREKEESFRLKVVSKENVKSDNISSKLSH